MQLVSRKPQAFPSEFTFCPHCGTKLEVTQQGRKQRRCCRECGWVQYRNPTVGVAVCLVEDRQLLIGQRRDGGLCIPCGHVEWDESIEDAAVREFQEETGLEVRLDGIVAAKSNFHLPERQTVGIWYRGQRTGGQLSVGSDLVEVCFVHLHHMPTLKFPTDNEVVAQLQSELWASR